MIDSDSIILPRIRDMRELCRNDTCLFYRGHCDRSTEQVRCTLWYSNGPSVALRKIDVSGDTAAVHRAMGQLKLVRSLDFIVPLSDFRYDASDDLPPTCRVRAGCPAETTH
jgi:hypothetical protein